MKKKRIIITFSVLLVLVLISLLIYRSNNYNNLGSKWNIYKGWHGHIVNYMYFNEDNNSFIIGSRYDKKWQITGTYRIEGDYIILTYDEKHNLENTMCRLNFIGNKMWISTDVPGDYAKKVDIPFRIVRLLYWELEDWIIYPVRKLFEKESEWEKLRRKDLEKMRKINEELDDLTEIKAKVYKILDYYRKDTNRFSSNDVLYKELIKIGLEGVPFYFKYLDQYPDNIGRMSENIIPSAIIKLDARIYLKDVREQLPVYTNFVDVIDKWNDTASIPIIIKAVEDRSNDSRWLQGDIWTYVEYIRKKKLKKTLPLLKKVFFRQYPRYYHVSHALADFGDTEFVDEYVKIYRMKYIAKRYGIRIRDWDKLKIIEALLISKDKRGVNLAVDLFYNCENSYFKDKVLELFKKYTEIKFLILTVSRKRKYLDTDYVTENVHWNEKVKKFEDIKLTKDIL